MYLESGGTVLISGQPIDTSGSHVWISGQHVYVESGLHVVADVAVEVSSGLFVDGISGQHVYVESGVWIAGVSLSGLDIQVNISGDPVSISGQPVDITSGAVVVDSGLHVWISGQHVYQESGAFVTAHGGIQVSGTIAVSGTVDIASGAIVVDSGLHVWISGQHVYQESGAFVTAQVSGTINVASGAVVVDSGLHVWISGQHVYQESGAVVGISGQIVLIGQSGAAAVAGIDQTVPSLITITTPHHEVHEGNVWHADCRISGLADDAVSDMLIKTGSGLEVHAFFNAEAQGDAWLEIYENVTVSDDGTAIPAHCMNRYISGTAKTTLFCAPTVTSTYTRLHVGFLPGGRGPQSAGGEVRPNTEWILAGVSGPVNYISRVCNVAGAAKDAVHHVEFYEELPGY